MKAVVLIAYGGVDQLELRDVPEPDAGPNEIKVRMSGASINPVDWKLRSGALTSIVPLQFPAILGRDASGVVVAVGVGVTAFQIGSRVMGLVTRAYAEFVVASTDAWADVPATMDLVDAGALPLVLLTGSQLVEEAVQPHTGDVILVTGAAGSVGRTAVFVAKARGAEVWAGVRHGQRAAARLLGAEGVVVLDDEAEISKLSQLDSIADTVGGETIKSLLGKVRRGGTIGSVVGEPTGAKERGVIVHGLWAHPDAKRLEELAGAVAQGRLTIPIAMRLPLSEARKAQELAEKGAGGKVVLTGRPF
jgi:NADPH:quinone reductase-like Zn-dependent oxidoreductase